MKILLNKPVKVANILVQHVLVQILVKHVMKQPLTIECSILQLNNAFANKHFLIMGNSKSVRLVIVAAKLVQKALSV